MDLSSGGKQRGTGVVPVPPPSTDPPTPSHLPANQNVLVQASVRQLCLLEGRVLDDADAELKATHVGGGDGDLDVDLLALGVVGREGAGGRHAAVLVLQRARVRIPTYAVQPIRPGLAVSNKSRPFEFVGRVRKRGQE